MVSSWLVHGLFRDKSVTSHQASVTHVQQKLLLAPVRISAWLFACITHPQCQQCLFTAQIYQMLTAEVLSGDLELLVDQKITQAFKASKHHAHSSPFGSMSTDEFLFLNMFFRCYSHT